MTAEALGSSFRDPSGTVFQCDGILLRQINGTYEAEWAALESSGLLAALWRDELMVRHSEVDPASGLSADAWKVIKPEPVPFVSYPYEWCFGQLKDAALLTLRIQRLALEHGMILRDASAFNIQFDRSRPLLIDTLSFGQHTEGQPWIAYRQFCQHFLLPLLLMSRVDPRLGLLSRDHLDGVPLDLGAAMLPRSTRWRPSIALHVHLHAASIRRHAATTRARPAPRAVSRSGLLGLIDNLASLIGKLDCRLEGGAWWDYEETHGYHTESRLEKERLVAELAGGSPGTVWDLGANTGRFAELLAPLAEHVVAMDLDHGAVERHWRRRREEPAAILPLVMDLTNPSPNLGWAEGERGGLLGRGPADTILVLAFVHHLAIGNNLPLDRLAAWLARIGRRVIIEWVPKEDPQVQRLLTSREDIFQGYQEEHFIAAFAKQFGNPGRAPVPNSGRVLYRFDRR
jgi:ribosomal protein L11 methylase PrmA